MKQYISLILIMSLFIPAVAFGQLDNDLNVENMNLEETIDGTTEAIGIVQTLINIGGEILSVFKEVVNVVDNWLQSTLGISLLELIKSLFDVVIKILEVVLDLIRNILA